MFAKKSLGQNFLMHPQTAERIALASGITRDSLVLEIGPGTGMLTRELLALAGRVVAVEADHSLLPGLEEKFRDEIAQKRLILVNHDIRSFVMDAYAEGPYCVVANIPYYITGEIMRQFLTATPKPTSMTLLVQKEVAVRIARDTKESILSLSVKVFGEPKYCFTVPRGAFRPAPNVDSAVLHIGAIQQDAFLSRKDEEFFFSLLRAGFSQKRKRLARNLEQVCAKGDIETAFHALNLSPNTRAETVSKETWVALSKILAR